MHGADGIATSSRASSAVAVSQRERINGWSCPWHPLQFVAWFFLIFFSVFYFGVIVFYLPKEWRAAGFIIPGGFCGIHLVYHLLALTIDPADPNIRGGTKKSKALFDRSKHRHVIENSHCYICQADVGSKSKHCSVCNKCVSDFDHHCKWLNNCVGGRNYRLFIGCISSAFVLAVLVFAVTLYVFVMFFTSKESLTSLSGGEFALFAPVPADEIFISFVGVMAGLLLLTICLLGHLLGFHLYLIYHKISTYEFIVSSRDHRPESSDVEEGSKSPASRKLFKNKVKPAEGESTEPERIEITDNERSEVSEDSLPNETTVKFINEVSSKAAAKQNRSNKEHESLQLHNSPAKTTPDVTQYSPQGITECATSSEESLKEITPPPTTPRVTVQQTDGVKTASAPQHCTEDSSDQHGVDTLSAFSRNTKVTMVTFEDEVEEIDPSPRGKKKKKARTSGATNTETLNDEQYELASISTKATARPEVDKVDTSTPRKKKKRSKATAHDSLPPVIVRRPLPQLKLNEDE